MVGIRGTQGVGISNVQQPLAPLRPAYIRNDGKKPRPEGVGVATATQIPIGY